MDFISQWDANFSNHRKRQLQLIELIERFSRKSHSLYDVKKLEEEFSTCGALFVVRLVSAIKRAFNCAQPVDLHLRVMLIFFQASDWERYLSAEDTGSCMHALLTVASLNPSEFPADVEQALLVLRRMLQSAHAVPVFVGLNGVHVMADVIESTLNTQLQRTCLSILFDCGGLDDPSQVTETVVRLLNAPRGTTKYCGLSLCRQLLASALRRSHIMATCGHQWLVEILPQLVRLLVNRPIFYQYECAAFVQELLDVPTVAGQLVELMNALMVLRCVVGGSAVIDNDAWKFIDSKNSGQKKEVVTKKPSKWGKLAMSVKTTSKIEDTMRDALVAVHAAKNKPMAGSLAAGGQALADVEIAQDPTVIVVRAVALLLNSCDLARLDLALAQPLRFGAGVPALLLRPLSGGLDGSGSVSLSMASALDTSSLLPTAHRSVALLGGRTVPATVAGLTAALTTLVDGRLHVAMVYNLLATTHRLLESNEAWLLRKLILLSGRPPSFAGGDLDKTGADLTESYSSQPLQFHSGSSRAGMSLERFYHDGIAVTFLMLLYTLQRWLNLDAAAKAQVWDLLHEFNLLEAYAHFDCVEDFESLGEESSEDSAPRRPPDVSRMREQDPLDLYTLLIVYIRLLTAQASDSAPPSCGDRPRSRSAEYQRTEILSGEGSDLVARQRRGASHSDALEAEVEAETIGPEPSSPQWAPRPCLTAAVDEMRRRLGGGALVAQLKSTLFEGAAADTRDRYAPVSKAERESRRGGTVRERKARSPYSPSRSQSRSISPVKGKSDAQSFFEDAGRKQTITSMTSSFSVGLQEAGPASPAEDGQPSQSVSGGGQDSSATQLAISFQELLNAAMRGANLSDYKNKNGALTNKIRNLNSTKGSGEFNRPSSRSSGNSGSRCNSASGPRHKRGPSARPGPPAEGRHSNRVSRRQQDDLRERLAEIRKPKSPVRGPLEAFADTAATALDLEEAGGPRRSSMRKGSARGGRPEGVAFADAMGQAESSGAVRFEGGGAERPFKDAQRIVIPTPPSSARGSFVPCIAVPPTAGSLRSPRRRDAAARNYSAGRTYRARDSPRARAVQSALSGGLSASDGTGAGTEAMQSLQAMFFGALSEQDDYY